MSAIQAKKHVPQLRDNGIKISYANYMQNYIGGIERVEKSETPEGERFGMINSHKFEVRCTKEERKWGGSIERSYGLFISGRCVHGYTGKHMVHIASKAVNDDE